MTKVFSRGGFYLFLICFSLLPLSFTMLGPILFAVYLICIVFSILISVRGGGWKHAVAGGAVFVYIAIYVFFGIYSIILSNVDHELIFKDSVGFCFYPIYFSLVALMVNGKINRYEWERFLIVLGVAVSIFHLVAYFAFYKIFDVLTFDTITLANTTLKDIGTASKYAASAGILRVDSGLGLLLIIPVLILLRNIIIKKFTVLYFLIIITLVLGIFIEGHRALSIAVLVGAFLYVLWMIVVTKNLAKVFYALVGLLLMMCSCMVIATAIYGEDLIMALERFTDLTSEGIDDDRLEQIPALIDKILEAPILGNGFGSNATIIRNVERPFLYEMDYLAIFMKLGIFGGITYFSAYIYILYLSVKTGQVDNQKMVYFFSGISFFVFAGTNGGMAMSVGSTLFQLYLMVGLSVEYYSVNQEDLCKTNFM